MLRRLTVAGRLAAVFGVTRVAPRVSLDLVWSVQDCLTWKRRLLKEFRLLRLLTAIDPLEFSSQGLNLTPAQPIP